MPCSGSDSSTCILMNFTPRRASNVRTHTDAAFKLFTQQLHPDSVLCFIRHLLTRYSKLQTFQTQPPDKVVSLSKSRAGESQIDERRCTATHCTQPHTMETFVLKFMRALCARLPCRPAASFHRPRPSLAVAVARACRHLRWSCSLRRAPTCWLTWRRALMWRACKPYVVEDACMVHAWRVHVSARLYLPSSPLSFTVCSSSPLSDRPYTLFWYVSVAIYTTNSRSSRSASWSSCFRCTSRTRQLQLLQLLPPAATVVPKAAVQAGATKLLSLSEAAAAAAGSNSSSSRGRHWDTWGKWTASLWSWTSFC